MSLEVPDVDLKSAFTDHDRLFKELLSVFFLDFVDLFLPEVMANLEPDSVSFLTTEVFTNVSTSEKHVVNILARARFRGEETFFLLHVENQSKAQPDFAERMFYYFSDLSRAHRLRVYPIALLTYDRPLRAGPNEFNVAFPDFEPLRFQYRAIQLNRLNWRDFLGRSNPVAAALMAKMKIAPGERPRVKLECLRIIATLRLDPARTQLLSGFVETYLTLSARETREFEREIAALPPEEREATMPLTISWKEEGRAEGLATGRAEGLATGRVAGGRELLLMVGAKRLGPATPGVVSAIERIDSPERIAELAEHILDVESWQELLALP